MNNHIYFYEAVAGDAPLPSSAVQPTSNSFPWGGGLATFSADGGFGAGTVKLQASFNGEANFQDVPLTSFTTAGMVNVELAPCRVRAVLTGATAPTLRARLLELGGSN